MLWTLWRLYIRCRSSYLAYLIPVILLCVSNRFVLTLIQSDSSFLRRFISDCFQVDIVLFISGFPTNKYYKLLFGLSHYSCLVYWLKKPHFNPSDVSGIPMNLVNYRTLFSLVTCVRRAFNHSLNRELVMVTTKSGFVHLFEYKDENLVEIVEIR